MAIRQQGVRHLAALRHGECALVFLHEGAFLIGGDFRKRARPGGAGTDVIFLELLRKPFHCRFLRAFVGSFVHIRGGDLTELVGVLRLLPFRFLGRRGVRIENRLEPWFDWDLGLPDIFGKVPYMAFDQLIFIIFSEHR